MDCARKTCRHKFQPEMASASELARSLKIKTGACQRLCKEVLSYHKEAERDQQRLQEKREAGADEHDLKQLDTVVTESKQMISECTSRLSTATIDLEMILEEASKDTGLSEDVIEPAKSALRQAKEQLAQEQQA